MPRLKFQVTANWEREEEETYIKHIKEKIREAREASGMTQSELAAQLNRAQNYFSKLEKGELVVSIVELLGIAEKTKRPIQYFLPIQYPDKAELSGTEWELLTHFRKIDDEKLRQAALGTVKQLAEMRSKEKK